MMIINIKAQWRSKSPPPSSPPSIHFINTPAITSLHDEHDRPSYSWILHYRTSTHFTSQSKSLGYRSADQLKCPQNGAIDRVAIHLGWKIKPHTEELIKNSVRSSHLPKYLWLMSCLGLTAQQQLYYLSSIEAGGRLKTKSTKTADQLNWPDSQRNIQSNLFLSGTRQETLDA